jgi:hypothetical protein
MWMKRPTTTAERNAVAARPVMVRKYVPPAAPRGTTPTRAPQHPQPAHRTIAPSAMPLAPPPPQPRDRRLARVRALWPARHDADRSSDSGPDGDRDSTPHDLACCSEGWCAEARAPGGRTVTTIQGYAAVRDRGNGDGGDDDDVVSHTAAGTWERTSAPVSRQSAAALSRRAAASAAAARRRPLSAAVRRASRRPDDNATPRRRNDQRVHRIDGDGDGDDDDDDGDDDDDYDYGDYDDGGCDYDDGDGGDPYGPARTSTRSVTPAAVAPPTTLSLAGEGALGRVDTHAGPARAHPRPAGPLFDPSPLEDRRRGARALVTCMCSLRAAMVVAASRGGALAPSAVAEAEARARAFVRAGCCCAWAPAAAPLADAMAALADDLSSDAPYRPTRAGVALVDALIASVRLLLTHGVGDARDADDGERASTEAADATAARAEPPPAKNGPATLPADKGGEPHGTDAAPVAATPPARDAVAPLPRSPRRQRRAARRASVCRSV